MRNKIFIISTLFILAFSLSLTIGCGDTSSSENIITDKDKMITAFAPVNEAIVNFSNLKKGTIIAESTGSFMPGGTAIRDELNFEKLEAGLRYKITETYAEGDPLVMEQIAEDDILPESAYLNYPNKEISDENFDTADKVIITKTDKGIEYRADWSLTQFDLPEGVTLKELYSAYTLDSKGYLVKVVHYRTYSEKKPDEINKPETTEFTVISLTDYSE